MFECVLQVRMSPSSPSIVSIDIPNQHLVVDTSRKSIYESNLYSVGMSDWRRVVEPDQYSVADPNRQSLPRIQLVLPSICQPVSQVCLQQIDQPYRHSSHSPEHLIGYGNPHQLAPVFRITNTTTNPSWHINRFVVFNRPCSYLLFPHSFSLSLSLSLSLSVSVLYLTNTHIATLRHSDTPSSRPIRYLSVQYRCTTSIFRGTPYHQRFRRWRVGDTKMSIPESIKIRCGK